MKQYKNIALLCCGLSLSGLAWGQHQVETVAPLKFDFYHSSLLSPSAEGLMSKELDVRMQENRVPNLKGRKAAHAAIGLLGSKYAWGGKDEKKGLDCSGFVLRSYQISKNGSLPRASFDMAKQLPVIKRSDLKEGDLLFFNTQGSGISHVGVYLGGGYFAHAPREGKLSRWDSLNNSYWAHHFKGARRPASLQEASKSNFPLQLASAVKNKDKQEKVKVRKKRKAS